MEPQSYQGYKQRFQTTNNQQCPTSRLQSPTSSSSSKSQTNSSPKSHPNPISKYQLALKFTLTLALKARFQKLKSWKVEYFNNGMNRIITLNPKNSSSVPKKDLSKSN